MPEKWKGSKDADAYVDSVMLSSNADDYLVIKTRIRSTRIPELGQCTGCCSWPPLCNLAHLLPVEASCDRASFASCGQPSQSLSATAVAAFGQLRPLVTPLCLSLCSHGLSVACRDRPRPPHTLPTPAHAPTRMCGRIRATPPTL
jgi:hypothetical protein